MNRLTNPQIKELVNLLLDCPAVQDRSLRDGVLAFLLNDKARHAIRRHDQDRADVVNIVTTCNQYPDALAELIEGVRCYNEGMFCMQALDDFRKNHEPPQVPHQPEPGNLNHAYLGIEEKLCRIDFEQAVNIFQGVMSDFGDDGGAMLLLLQESHRMGGKWLLKRIHEVVAKDFYPIYEYELGFSSSMPHGKYGILQKLEEYFSVHEEADEAGHFSVWEEVDEKEQYTNRIINRICESISAKRVVFIRISEWNRFTPHDTMLQWFVQEFWVRLVDTLYVTIAQKDLRKVRLVIVLVSESKLHEKVLEPHLGCPDPFISQKLLCLPLEKWSLEDIRDWLTSYSSIMIGEKIDATARDIYEASGGGSPDTVADILLERFAHRQEQ